MVAQFPPRRPIFIAIGPSLQKELSFSNRTRFRLNFDRGLMSRQIQLDHNTYDFTSKPRQSRPAQPQRVSARVDSQPRMKSIQDDQPDRLNQIGRRFRGPVDHCLTVTQCHRLFSSVESSHDYQAYCSNTDKTANNNTNAWILSLVALLCTHTVSIVQHRYLLLSTGCHIAAPFAACQISPIMVPLVQSSPQVDACRR